MIGGLLAMVSEPARIPAIRSEPSSQQDTRTQDDDIANSGREQARNHDEAKPDQPGKDQPPRFGSIGKTVHAGAQSAVKLGSA